MTNSPNQMPKRGIPLGDLVKDVPVEYEDDVLVSAEVESPRIKGFATKSGSMIIDTFRPLDYLEIPEGEVVDDKDDDKEK